MKADAVRDIIDFPSTEGIDGSAGCKICGTAQRTHDLCDVCAFRLVDIALSDGPTDLACLPPPNGLAEQPFQRVYDHFEVCLDAEGAPWELGRGSMGITYRAIDTRLGCPVALKIINATRLSSASARERFLREARTAAHLRHANIASVFHLGLGENDCFYAMELVEGETLEARVRRRGPLSYDIALNITAQCARALRVAHAHDFIHRDIKPSNIMLLSGEHHSDDDCFVKLIDFGLAKALSENLSRDIIVQNYFAGTPNFASPEQFAGNSTDTRSDIYSLGKCLAFMLNGALPTATAATFGTDYPPRVVVSSSGGCVGHSPKRVNALLDSLTSSDPDRRVQTVDELLSIIQTTLKCMQPDNPRARQSDAPINRFHQFFDEPRRVRIGIIALALLIGALALFHWKIFTPQKQQPLRANAALAAAVEARVYYAQAEECYQQNQAAENQRAIELYSRAILSLPMYADAHAGLADAYLRNVSWFAAPTEQLALATASAERAAAIAPHNPRPFASLSAIKNYKGKPWEALAEMRLALELAPDQPELMRKFSKLWTTVGRPDLGLPWALMASRIEPSSIVAATAVAEASLDLGDDEQAEHFYRLCLEVDPLSLPGHVGLIHLHLVQGNFADARRAGFLAQGIRSDALIPLTLKAQIAFFSGDFAEAEATYRRLLEMDRAGSVSFYGGIRYLSALGYLRRRAGDLVESNKLLDEATRLDLADSQGPQAAYDLAAVFATQNRRDESLTLLQQSIASGWKDYRSPLLDPRFESLRQDPRFVETLSKLKADLAHLRENAFNLCAKPLRLADYPVQPTQPE